MAFNPFTGFQRNRKFWMAMMVLLSMTTFVFCGFSGDMSERLLQRFRSRGAAIGSINGQNITRNELYELRRQRDMANEFMRVLAKEAVKNYSDRIKSETEKLRTADAKQQQSDDFRKKQAMLQDFSILRAELISRLQQPRYFEIGTKLDDLMEFLIWQAQADRLGIALTEEYVRQMVLTEVYNFVSREQLITAGMEARRGSQQASDALLTRALTEEFRVRIAQLATIQAQPSDYDRAQDIRTYNPMQPTEIRAPLSPAMMWDFYKDKRSQFDVRLVPIYVNDFVSKVAAPDETEQQSYFRRHQGDAYDPASPTPGLQLPAKAKVAFVMADPNSPAYLHQAQARLVLPAIAPCLDPLQPALVMAAGVIGNSLAYDFALERAYGTISRFAYRGAAVTDADVMSPLTAWLAKRDARAAASVLGNVTGGVAGQLIVAPFTTPNVVAGYLAWGSLKQPDVLEAALRAEIRERAPVYNAMVGGALNPWSVLSALTFYDQMQPTLPLAVVRREIEDIMAREKAEQWARDNMRVVRDKLERLSGQATAFGLALGNYVAQYKLRYAETPTFYNRYNIGQAPALEPLERSFEKYVDQINFLETRDVTPERMLRTGDFYKLFFGSERFTAEGAYRPMPWPPVLIPGELNIHQRRTLQPPELNPALRNEYFRYMQNQDPARPRGTFDLFNYAEKPSLYWKTGEESADKPKELAQVRERVIDALRLQKAREEQALPLAKDIAFDLQQKAPDFSNTILASEAAKAGHPLIDLPNLSALYPERTDQFGLSREYVPYPLPKDVFAYPREDMVEQLLRLYDLREPIKISSGEGDLAVKRELDRINKELWDKTNKQFKTKDAPGHYVQILANKPLTELYVAVVPIPPAASRDDFFMAMQNTPWMAQLRAWMQQMQFNRQIPAPPTDPLIVLAQKAEGKRVRDALLRQLRLDLKVEAPEDAELRQDFDRGN